MCGLDKQIVKYVESWLNGHPWRVVISVMKSSRRVASSSVHQGLLLSPVPFNIVISGLDNGAACTLSKIADDTKLKVFITPESCSAIQRDLHGLVKWADRNHMQFINMCKILHMSGGTTPCIGIC